MTEKKDKEAQNIPETPKPESVNTAIAISAPVVSSRQDDEVFDFTIDRAGMDAKTGAICDMLRRKATLTITDLSDPKQKSHYDRNLPDGRKLNKSEVEALLGETLDEAFIKRKCCG